MPNKNSYITCDCGAKIWDWMFRPIRCQCGAWYDDGQQPAQQYNHTPPQKINPWDQLHGYAPKNRDTWNSKECSKWLCEWQKTVPCGTCVSNWKDYVNRNPVHTATPEQFFEWTVTAHNYVSTTHVSPPKPIVPLEQAYAMFWGRLPNSYCDYKRLVITIGTGTTFNEILELTKPNIQAYANKCNADFITLTNTTEPWWGFEKFRVKQFAEQYDQTLFVDADVIIRPTTPNLFDLVPLGTVGIHDDWPLLHTFVEWLHGDRFNVFNSQKVEGIYPKQCLNTGVVVCCKQTANIWTRPTDDLPRDHTSEQTWVEHQCWQHPITYLPTSFNTQWWMLRFPELEPLADIVHLANCTNRIPELKRYLRQWQIESSSGVRPALDPIS